MVQKEELEAAGVKFLPDLQYIKRPAYPSRLRRIFGMLAGDPKVLCQGAQYADDFKQAIGDYHPDLIVTVWSEMPTTMLYSSPFPVFAFYGNPDEKVAVAHIYANIALHKAWRKPKHWMDLAKSIIGLALFWPAHRKVIKSLAGIANNSFHDKDFYNYTGVSNTSHVRNMLEVDRSFEWCPRRDKTEQVAPLKIIGSAGLMSATGNTIGLEVIATRILPELKKSLGEGNFEIHLFGSGEPLPFLKPLLDDPHIKIRGFVKDLEEEILSAPVFLVANGFHPLFHMGNSRILHGWALGACMVVFDGTRDAMPEMVDGYNALLGKTPEEITWQIIRAGKDKTLRRRIGQNGYDTVTTLFDPKIVVTDLIKKIEIATSDMNSAPAVENRQE
jgi:glycosyltransferase involved in cell wall biosynthesis